MLFTPHAPDRSNYVGIFFFRLSFEKFFTGRCWVQIFVTCYSSDHKIIPNATPRVSLLFRSREGKGDPRHWNENQSLQALHESLSTIKTRRKNQPQTTNLFFLHPKTQPNKRIEKDPFPSKQTKTVVPDQTMKKTYLKWLWIFSLSFFFVWKHCQCYVHISMNSFVIRGEEHFGFHFGFLKICKFMNDAIIFFFPKIMSWFAYSNPKKGALVMERRGLWKRKCRSRTWNYIP